MAAIEDPVHPALGKMHAHEAHGVVWLHAWHDAFSLPDDVIRCHRYLAVDPRVGWLLIVDHLTAATPQTWQQYWLFQREDVILGAEAVTIGTRARLLLRGGQPTVCAQQWSPSYGVLAPGRQLTVKAQGATAVLAMLLLPAGVTGALSIADSTPAWSVDVTAGAFQGVLTAADWHAVTTHR
jgi:hypothetical protein